MADSTTSTAPTSPNANIDLTGFIQAYKIGPVLQARALRDQIDLARRNAERVYEQVHGLPKSPEKKAEEDVIQVDSPTTTVTHNYPAPQAAPAALGALAKIGLAFAISGPIGAGIAAIPVIQSWLSKPAAVAPTTPVTPNPQTLYDLRLGGS